MFFLNKRSDFEKNARIKLYTEKKKHDSLASGKEWFMSEDKN